MSERIWVSHLNDEHAYNLHKKKDKNCLQCEIDFIMNKIKRLGQGFPEFLDQLKNEYSEEFNELFEEYIEENHQE